MSNLDKDETVYKDDGNKTKSYSLEENMPLSQQQKKKKTENNMDRSQTSTQTIPRNNNNDMYDSLDGDIVIPNRNYFHGSSDGLDEDSVIVSKHPTNNIETHDLSVGNPYKIGKKGNNQKRHCPANAFAPTSKGHKKMSRQYTKIKASDKKESRKNSLNEFNF
jgi:hypothetical protein